MANAKTKEEVRQENIETKISATEKFYEAYKKTIWTVLSAIVIVVLAVLAYNKFIYQPKAEEAKGAAYPAEMAFQRGDFELALKGDGNVYGFEEVISEYGSKSGKAVYLYAGICALQLGEFEDAISYLKKYNGKDAILAARAIACQGDAYVGLEEYGKAASCFCSAAAKADNVFAATYLLKAGLAYEKLGEPEKALAVYKTIEDKYPQSIEGYDIDKYIARVSAE